MRNGIVVTVPNITEQECTHIYERLTLDDVLISSNNCLLIIHVVPTASTQ